MLLTIRPDPRESGIALDKASEAVNELTKALNEEKRRNADGSLDSIEGKGVFDKMKKANEKMRGVSNPPAALISAMDALVALAEDMAQAKIDEPLPPMALSW